MPFLSIQGHAVAWFFGALLCVAAFIGGILMIAGGLYLATLILDWFAERIARSFVLHREFSAFYRERFLKRQAAKGDQ